jgi:cytosine/uracil/thiamine/allantoin permease
MNTFERFLVLVVSVVLAAAGVAWVRERIMKPEDFVFHFLTGLIVVGVSFLIRLAFRQWAALSGD